MAAYPSGLWNIDFAAEQAKPKPADLASQVLDAMTCKLRDYDRLATALTAAQEAATRNLERARLAEDERNSYRAAAESDAREVDAVRDVLRATSSESASDAARRAARTLWPCPGTVNHPLRKTIDTVATKLGMRPTEAVTDAARRVMRELDEARVERDKLREERDRIRRVADATALGVTPLRVCDPLAGAHDAGSNCAVITPDHAAMVVELRVELAAVRKALDDSRALAERLGEAFDCHPGELPRVGRSLSAAMVRIAKCVDMAREDEGEVADAVERLREERDALRAAKPEPKLTPLHHHGTLLRLTAGEQGPATVYTFDGASIDVCYVGAHVARWELREGARSLSANYGLLAVSKDEALADINTVLARYGYVLEAWP